MIKVVLSPELASSSMAWRHECVQFQSSVAAFQRGVQNSALVFVLITTELIVHTSKLACSRREWGRRAWRTGVSSPSAATLDGSRCDQEVAPVLSHGDNPFHDVPIPEGAGDAPLQQTLAKRRADPKNLGKKENKR